MERKRLRRWLLGVMIAVALLLAAFVTLPWWLPREWVRGRIEQELSRQLGRQANLEGFTLSHEGFELRKLVIRGGPTDEETDLITIARISGPYEPLNLLRGRLSRLRVEQPQVNLVINREGRLNVADLPGRLDLKHNRFDLDTLVISGASVHLHSLSNPDKDTSLDIPHIGWTGGEKTLQWRLDAQLRGYEDAAVMCSGRTLRPNSGGTHWIQVEFNAENLPLEALHLQDLFNPQLASLGGEPPVQLAPLQGRGTLAGTFSLDTAGVLGFDTRLTLKHLDVTTAAGRTPSPEVSPVLLRAENIVLASKGRYDLTTTAIDIESAQFSGPGLDLDLATTYNPIAPQQDAHYDLRRVHIHFEQLMAASPRLAQWSLLDELGLGCCGEVLLTGRLDLGAQRSAMDFTLNADNMAFTSIGGDKPQGKKLSLTLNADYQADTAVLRLNAFDLQWSSLRLEGALVAPDIYSLRSQLQEEPPAVWLRTLFSRPDLRAALHVHIDDYDDLANDVPSLAQPLPGVIFHGPLEASLTLEADAHLASLDVHLPQEAHLQLENLHDPNGGLLLDKPAGQDWRVQCRAEADAQGELTDITVKSSYGAAELEAAPVRLHELWTAAADVSRQVQSPWRMTRLEDWLTLSPQLAGVLQQAGVRLAGAAQGTTQLTLAPDKSLRLEGDVRLNEAQLQAQGSIQAVAPAQNGDVPLPQRIYHVDARVQMDDLSALHYLLPEIIDAEAAAEFPAVTLDHLRGPATCQAVYHNNHVGARLSLEMDGEQAGFQLRRKNDGTILWGKQPQQRCNLRAEMLLNIPGHLDKLIVAPLTSDASPAWRIHIEQADLQIEQSQVTLTGKAALDPPADPQAYTPPRYRRFDGEWNAHIHTQDTWLRRAWQLVQIPFEENPTGLIILDGRFLLDRQQGLDLQAGADLTAAAWSIDAGMTAAAPLTKFNKPKDTPCRLAVHLTAPPDVPNLHLDKLDLELDGNRFVCSGDVRLADHAQLWKTWEPNTIVSVSVHTDLEAPRLEQIARCLPELHQNQIAGSLILRLPLEFTPGAEKQLTLQPAFVRAELRGIYRDTSFALQLHAPEVSRQRLRLPLCRLNVAQNDISLVADIQELPVDNAAPTFGSYEGTVQVLADTLDVDDILRRLHIEPVVSAAPAWNESQKDMMVRGLNSLRRSRMQLAAQIGRLKITDPATQAWLDLAEIRANADLAENSFTARFTASLNGGVTTGTLQSDLAAEDPVFDLHTENRNLRVDETILPMIETQFPGMEVSGTVTEITDQQVTFSCLLDAGCHPHGQGSTLLTQGVLYGPGGPEWMLTVFPGLKLVEYPYERMTNRFELLPDGTQKNDIRFRGENYDIFMEGTSTPVTDNDDYARAIAALEADFRSMLERLEEMDRRGSSLSAEKVRRLRYDLEGLDVLFRRHQSGRHLPVYYAQYIVGALVRFGPDEPGKPARELIRTPLFTTRGYIIGRNMIGITTTNAPLAEIPKQTPIWRHFETSP